MKAEDLPPRHYRRFKEVLAGTHEDAELFLAANGIAWQIRDVIGHRQPCIIEQLGPLRELMQARAPAGATVRVGIDMQTDEDGGWIPQAEVIVTYVAREPLVRFETTVRVK